MCPNDKTNIPAEQTAPMPAMGNVPELHSHMARESVHRERSCDVSEYKESPGIGAKVCIHLSDLRLTLTHIALNSFSKPS